MNKYIFILFILSSNLYAYVHVKTNTGNNVIWNHSGSNIYLYVNPTPVDANTLTQAPINDIKNIIENSVAQWNEVFPYELIVNYTSSDPRGLGKASISFSSNPAYFGSGVVAVTSTGYDSDTGSVYSSDILINNSYKEYHLQK